MKKAIVTILIAITANSVFGQVIVSDPIVGEATVATHLQTIKSTATEGKNLLEAYKQTRIYQKLLDHQDDIKKAMETYEVVKKLETVKRLEKLITTLACATEDFEFYLGFTGNYTTCITQIELDKMLLKFEASSDIMYLIFGGAKLISSGDRINSLTQAISLLEEAYEDMMNIQDKIRIDVKEQMVKKYLKESLVNEYSYFPE